MPGRQRFHRIDGGYAWIVAVASLFSYSFIFGSLKSGGIFLVALNRDYGVSRDKAAYIGATAFGALFGTSIFVSGFVNRFGFRPVHLVGSFFVFLGVFISYFVKNPDLLILTFGAIQGIGYGICFVPNFSIVSHHFKKYRAIANGIGTSGGPLGSFLFPPLFEYLIEQYSLRGTYLIFSGITLHMFVFSFLMLEPPYSSPISLQVISDSPKDETLQLSEETIEERANSDVNKKVAFVEAPEESDEEHKKKDVEEDVEDGLQEEKSEVETLVQSEPTGVLSAMRYHPENVDVIYKPTVEGIPQKSSFKDDIVFTLKNGFTYLLMLHMAVVCITVISFFLTIPDYAVSGGVDLRDAAFLISMSSVADVFSRLILGYFMDRKCVSLSFSFAFSYVTASVGFLVCGFAGRTSYSALMVGSVLYGICYGSVMVHFPVMVSHYVGLKYMTTTVSICSIVNLVFSFISAPIANAFLHSYGSYMYLYVFCAAIFFFNGFLWIIVMFREGGPFQRRKKYLPRR